MKVKIGNYPRLLSVNTLSNHLVRKYSIDSTRDPSWIERVMIRLEELIDSILDVTINRLLVLKGRTIDVKIHDYDLSFADETMSYVILPMLYRIRDRIQRTPYIESKDVPKNLRATKKQQDQYYTDGTLDSKVQARWDWVIEEMIYAFESLQDDELVFHYFSPNDEESWDTEKYDQHHARMKNGLELFGKYYTELWV